MVELIGKEVREQVRERLAGLERPVRILYFTQEHACGACTEQRGLLEVGYTWGFLQRGRYVAQIPRGRQS